VQEYHYGAEHVRGEGNFVARLIPHIRKDESDEIDSLWNTALSTDVGPSHPMTVDPVEEVDDDALDVPALQPQTETCLPFAAPVNDEEQIFQKTNINSLALSIIPLLATWEWIRLAIA